MDIFAYAKGLAILLLLIFVLRGVLDIFDSQSGATSFPGTVLGFVLILWFAYLIFWKLVPYLASF